MVPVFTFFAVGKANMVLIQFSNGINMLVNCHSMEGWPTTLELRSEPSISCSSPTRIRTT